MALKEIVISGVSVMRQMGSDLLVFVIDATELLKFATTLRYEDSHQLGINRDLVHNRVKEIAKAMKQPDATMRGALQGAFYAGDGDDAAGPLGHHLINDRLYRQEGPFKVDIDNLVPGVFIKHINRATGADTGGSE